jgi:hypothetical protein
MTLMDFRIGLFSALLLLASCGTKKNCCASANADDTLIVAKTSFSGTIQTHRPHCGGMRPSPEQEQGFIEPVINADFYIYQGSVPTNKADFTKVTTDASGKFSVDLAQGNYNIIQANKLLSLEKFIELNTPGGKYYKASPPTCFETWKNAPDFSFVVTASALEKVFTERHRCFTGANPCLKYDGPYPP